MLQVSTCMKEPALQLDPKPFPSHSVEQTRERLLDAAARTFSTDGIQGATTRQIAREAGVNEVTLFRHFKSKEQLLGAVLERGLASEIALMNEHSSWKENLRQSMENYARHYYSHLEKKQGFARAFIAEGQVLPKAMQTMVANVVRPVRERLIAILADAQKAGVLRPDLNVECALDAFKNTLYAGVLRQGAYLPRSYSTEAYIETVIDIFVRGIQATPKNSTSES
jgi:AcrR family transcriptional regulator